jgi:hypothetical protein
VTPARLVPHWSGLLMPVPRGSKLTTSVEARTEAGNSGYSIARI